MKRCVLPGFLSLVLIALMLSPSRAQSYTVTDLGTLGGNAVVYGINASGQITGYGY